MLWKKFILLFKYHFRKLVRKMFFFTMPIILFSLSFTLFLFIIIPNLFHNLPIFKHWIKVYSIKGNILGIDNKNKYFIEVGGYNSIVKADGKFELKFSSATPTKIPVIISVKDSQYLYRISYDKTIDLDTTFLLNMKNAATKTH
jgi:hypothetical protein